MYVFCRPTDSYISVKNEGRRLDNPFDEDVEDICVPGARDGGPIGEQTQMVCAGFAQQARLMWKNQSEERANFKALIKIGVSAAISADIDDAMRLKSNEAAPPKQDSLRMGMQDEDRQLGDCGIVEQQDDDDEDSIA